MHPKYYRLEKSPPELSTYPSRKHLILLFELEWFIPRAAATIVNLPLLLWLENSAPFHCSLMQPAADAMKEALKDIQFEKPIIDVVSNVTAQPVRTQFLSSSLIVCFGHSANPVSHFFFIIFFLV